jgi:DNA-binding IclR family transcriptional regulator
MLHKPPSEHDTAGAQTLRRGLLVVRLLTRIGPAGLRMDEICRRVDLSKSTAVRLTRTLVHEGFVLHDRGSGRYRLGPEAFAAGPAAEPSDQLQRLSAPNLRALVAESGDTVFFAVRHGDESICLSRDEGDLPLRSQVQKPGDRFPLGVGAGSCAMLAALADDDITDVLARSATLRAERFPRFTDEAIHRVIAAARERSYRLVPGLVLADSWAVGVVVFDTEGQPVASISLTVIKSRLGLARCATLGNRMMVASRSITALAAQVQARAG